jgi:hypothetical protein
MNVQKMMLPSERLMMTQSERWVQGQQRGQRDDDVRRQ